MSTISVSSSSFTNFYNFGNVKDYYFSPSMPDLAKKDTQVCNFSSISSFYIELTLIYYFKKIKNFLSKTKNHLPIFWRK